MCFVGLTYVRISCVAGCGISLGVMCRGIPLSLQLKTQISKLVRSAGESGEGSKPRPQALVSREEDQGASPPPLSYYRSSSPPLFSFSHSRFYLLLTSSPSPSPLLSSPILAYILLPSLPCSLLASSSCSAALSPVIVLFLP